MARLISIPLEEISISDRRLASVSLAKVERYRALIESGRVFPPIRLARDGAIRNGRHRYLAARAAGLQFIDALRKGLRGLLAGLVRPLPESGSVPPGQISIAINNLATLKGF